MTLMGAFGSLLSGCGGGDGPALDAVPQSIAFQQPTPTLQLGSNATLTASASSGLPVSYTSLTPAICSVGGDSGVITALTLGTCQIVANQDGNSHYAPAPVTKLTLVVQVNRAQTISFSPSPSLSVYGSATIAASASSGLAVSFNTTTPLICQVNAQTGLITAQATGSCVIVATQAGDAHHDAAPPVSTTLSVGGSAGTLGVPSAPQGVSATLGSTDDTVIVSYAGLSDAGGSPITAYTVASVPAGLSASSASGPITVTCPLSCAGYAFSLSARNASGDGPASATAEVITTFDVRARFFEPDTQPNDSIFVGTFTLNSTTRAVSGLAGTLSESMTGSANGSTPMTLIALTHQLSSVSNGAGGLLASSFALNTIDTFSPSGFADTTNGIYHGFPAVWNAATANSFVTLDIDPNRPTQSLNASQVSRLAYGDCAQGGMMGAACMTGTASGGTMGGYPVEQVVSRRFIP
ncbi:MAG: fibronectin type III domain-containing protein [Leptothrix ochracea]|uniref:fibronectin type III domain-containing protein n=1 Tax=Leptothrix ochracea TaxID=735331 RepID=UPI0034E2335A